MYRVLIVDDEYEIRNGLSKYFPWKEAGFQVVGQVESGKEALAFLRTHDVDLVLTDIMMASMSGLELAEKIHHDFPAVGVCILTAYKEFDYAQRAISLNVIRYILKSCSSSELLSEMKIVHDILEKRQGKKTITPEDNLPAAMISPVNDSDQLVTAIQTYVIDHLDSVDLTSAAEAVFLSPSYMSKLFKERTGQKFSDYVLQKKMEKSLELLRNHHYKIYEISEKIGYDYVKNFSRVFSKYFGITPRDFRNGKPIRRSGHTEDL